MNKRTLDLFVIAISAPLTLPIMGVTCVLLSIFQGGPIFFRQKRIGKDGKEFSLIKFRTMRMGAQSDMQRVTSIGKILRKLSIDELPEILNIVKGEMSIVGPRPLPIEYRSFFSEKENKRHDVLPGLTGLAQVSGRNQFSWKDKFQKDLEYIHVASTWMDLKIIIKTFVAIFNFSNVNASENQTMAPLTERLHIIGAGGHAKVVCEAARAQGIEIAGFFDDAKDLQGMLLLGYPIEPIKKVPKNSLVVCAIGNNEIRKKFSKMNVRFKTIIHPNAVISSSAIIGEGSVVFAGSYIQAKVVIGKHCIINTKASVDHDCEIEDFCHIAPGTTLCGGVKVGEQTLVGVGASITPYVEIPKSSTIAANSSVTKNLNKPNCLWTGSPAKLKKDYSMKNQNKTIPMALPDITEAEAQAVLEVVHSKRLALGPKIEEFEKVFAQYTNRKHAIAVSSGTAGLHLALMALGVKEGDEVMVPSYTFVASVNCILYVGATPVFIDIDDKDYCIDVADAKRKLTSKTKAIVSVDVFGHPAPLDKLEDFCNENNLYLVDDSCEALGAKLHNRKVGNFGDVASFAFYPNKQITTGEGGMIVTDSDEVARKCRMLMNQGRDTMSQWLEHAVLGYNYRMSEIQAALGVVQMSRLDEILNKRETVANWYNEAFKDSPWLDTQHIKEGVEMSWFVFVVTLKDGYKRDEVIKRLQARDIAARAYFTPIHTQPYLANYPTKGEDHLPVTNKVGEKTMALPFFGDMTKEQCQQVAQEVNEVMASMTLEIKLAA
ncbi:MAG: NeuD/PglB/VioB family sugar acetyltransferase [Bacteriovoracaceae bacterium]|nr:NeuD/PglB/VioB family sugar acetyltransferase [Bacteriovoracaceae bacterium]